ncbi:hypothetical protein CC86DRAFT_44879 [Ophiobolus disseminans]|uniref:Uncharacterized protein n=1 Tax=Ophiobolus disseminans TaxID=1469910 RepID=A0A6A6ZU81_9PLEO|nr:hypothetical protein CC86DRAFT_44879 [Ophiobolus disseminans]
MRVCEGCKFHRIGLYTLSIFSAQSTSNTWSTPRHKMRKDHIFRDHKPLPIFNLVTYNLLMLIVIIINTLYAIR